MIETTRARYERGQVRNFYVGHGGNGETGSHGSVSELLDRLRAAVPGGVEHFPDPDNRRDVIVLPEAKRLGTGQIAEMFEVLDASPFPITDVVGETLVVPYRPPCVDVDN